MEFPIHERTENRRGPLPDPDAAERVVELKRAVDRRPDEVQRALQANDDHDQAQQTEARPPPVGGPARLCDGDPAFPRWLVPNTRSVLGGALLGEKKYREAEPLLVGGAEELLRHQGEVPANGRWNLPEVIERVARFYAETGRPAEAEEWRARRAGLPPTGPPPPIPPAAP